MTQSAMRESATLHIENIGGITESSVELDPGVTILAGRNATNRTSLLQAIMAALGSDTATLKGDAEEGRVELTIDDTTYTRHLSREDGTITTRGDPYLEDATLADLFAFLLETNDARRAVARGDDLREIITQPIDTSEIERQIEQYQSRRDDIDNELEDINKSAQKLPDLEGERADINEKIDKKESKLLEIEDKIDDIDEKPAGKQGETDELEEKLDELNEARSQLESVRHKLETQRESLDVLDDEREELEAEKKTYEEISEDRLDGIETEIQRLRDRKDTINNSINDLQTVIEFNEGLLDGDLDTFGDLQQDDTDNPTDQLLESTDELVCWTCGNETDTTQIDTMLDKLRSLREQYMEKRKSVTDQIADLNNERQQLKERQRQRTQIKSRLENIAQETTERENRIAELKDRRRELKDTVQTLEVEVEELQDEDDEDSELIDFHKEANRLEVEIERLEADLETITEEINRVEQRVAERNDLESQRKEIQEEIEKLRGRVDSIEETAVEEFNTHMQAVLDILSYDNLERIWIERTKQEVRDGRQTVTRGRFNMHIVRSSESGTVYEDTIDHLSESEREVTGLIFALAGYLVHNVHETAPFMLLDSVEAIDAQRLADLINYLHDHSEYLVVALLEEDAQALRDDYKRIREI